MKVFPYYITRMAGLTYESLQQLQSPTLIAAVAKLVLAQAHIAEWKERVSDILFEAAKNETDIHQKQAIINTKRNLFNGKLRKQEREVCERLLNQHQQCQPLQAYLTAFDTLAQSQPILEDLYRQAVQSEKKLLHHIAAHSDLQAGILLSSHIFFHELQGHLAKQSGGERFTDVEVGLLKYVSRMATKTSPFSRFATLSCHGYSSSQPTILQDSLQVGNSSVFPRLNSQLLKHITHLLELHEDTLLQLSLILNPTIELHDGFYCFITNRDGMEAFQRLRQSPILDLIKESIGAEMVAATLLHSLQEACDASRVDLLDYIKRLLAHGFFEINWGTTGLDPDWYLRLLDLFAHPRFKGIDIVASLSELLQNIATSLNRYEALSISDKAAYLQNTYLHFRDWSQAAHQLVDKPFYYAKALYANIPMAKDDGLSKAAAPPVQKVTPTAPYMHNEVTYFGFKPENIIYEDVIRHVPSYLPTDVLSELVAKLNRLVHFNQLYEMFELDRKMIADFFSAQYDRAAKIPLLLFYEAFAKHKKENKALLENLSNVLEQQRLEVYGYCKAIFDKATENGIRQDGHLHITAGHLPPLEMPPATANVLQTEFYSSFMQVYTEQEDGVTHTRAVIDGINPGYGKYFSRFFHLLDEGPVQAQRQWNLDLQPPGQCWMENMDNSFFNANIHLPLLACELRSPGSSNKNQQQIAVNDILVQKNASNGEVELVHVHDGKRIVPLDLMFQVVNTRTPLYQFLDKFTLVRYVPLKLIVKTLKAIYLKQMPATSLVTVVPRIVFEQDIVLCRKCWTVQVAALPPRSRTETDVAFYQRVLYWKLHWQIPDEVFMHVIPDKNTASQYKQVAKDDYKPQYIHFGITGLVMLFGKLLTKCQGHFLLEEFLPSGKEMFTFNHQQRATECFIQWTTKE